MDKTLCPDNPKSPSCFKIFWIILSVVAVFGVAVANLVPEPYVKHAPQPYKFGYSVKDKHGEQHREEVGDGANGVKGSYGFTDDRGVHRQVDYVADHAGFRAQVKTNEPGTANQDPAAVKMISAAPYAGPEAGILGAGLVGAPAVLAAPGIIGVNGLGYEGLGYNGLGVEGYGDAGYAGLGYGGPGYAGLGYGGLGYGGLEYKGHEHKGLGHKGLGYAGLGYGGLGYGRLNDGRIAYGGYGLGNGLLGGLGYMRYGY